jgi:rRNA processing protein Gar1
MDFGPPSYVIPYGTFLHRCENAFVVKCTDMTRFPKFNRGIYLENKSKVGTVD